MKSGDDVLSNTMDPFERLLAHAQSSVEGTEANQALWDARAELERKYTNVVMYEMVLREGVAWDAFLRSQIPKITEHLFAKGIPMAGGPSVVLSLWRGSKMFMFDCGAFFDAIREIEGISTHELWTRISGWRLEAGLASVAGVAAPLQRLLGPPPKADGN